MKRFLVIVLICFLLGWNIGIMISNEMLKVENKNLREEIKLYKGENGVKIFGMKKIFGVKLKNYLECEMWWAKQMFGSEKIFSQNYTPKHLFGLSGKKIGEHLFDEKMGRTFVWMLLVEHC